MSPVTRLERNTYQGIGLTCTSKSIGRNRGNFGEVRRVSFSNVVFLRYIDMKEKQTDDTNVELEAQSTTSSLDKDDPEPEVEPTTSLKEFLTQQSVVALDELKNNPEFSSYYCKRDMNAALVREMKNGEVDKILANLKDVPPMTNDLKIVVEDPMRGEKESIGTQITSLVRKIVLGCEFHDNTRRMSKRMYVDAKD